MQTAQETAQAQAFYESVNWQGVINRIAEGLGTTGEYLWEVLVHGTMVDGVVSLIALSLMWLVGLGLTIYGYKSLRKMPWQQEWSAESTWCRFWFMGAIPVIVGLILTTVFLANLKDCGMKIGAPEYEALRFLITEAKS